MNLDAPISLNELPTQFNMSGRRFVLRAMPQPRVATRAVGVFDADSAHPSQPPVFVKWATGAIDIALLRWEYTVLMERVPAEAPVLCPIGWVEVGAYSGLVLPYQRGPTIERALRSRSLSLGEIMGLTAALCEAVAPLAAQGWQHHDLKPENLLITPDGLLLVDLESASSAFEGPPGGPRISPRYQPPEREFGLTRDVYSIGVMLMDLLALRLGRSFAITSVGLWEALDMAMGSHTTSDGATLDLLARTLDRDPNRRPTCMALGEAAGGLRDALAGPRGAELMGRLAPDLAGRPSERGSETTSAPRPPTLWTQNPLLTDLPGARQIGVLKVAETLVIPLLPLAALLLFCVVSAVTGVTLHRSLWSLLGLSLAVPVICNAVQRAKEASQSGDEGGWLSPHTEQPVWGKLAERSSPDRFIAAAIGLCFGIATALATMERADAEPVQGILLASGQALVCWLCLKPLRVLALINETFARAPDRWLWGDERRRRLVTVFVRRLLASMVLAQVATLAWALVNLWPLQIETLGATGRLLLLLWGGFVLAIGLGPLLFTMAGFRLYLHRLEDELHNTGPSTARFNFVSRREWWSLAMAQAGVVMLVVWKMTLPAVAVEAVRTPTQTPAPHHALSCSHNKVATPPPPIMEPPAARVAGEGPLLHPAPPAREPGETSERSPPRLDGSGLNATELNESKEVEVTEQDGGIGAFSPPPAAPHNTRSSRSGAFGGDGIHLAQQIGQLVVSGVDFFRTAVVTIRLERCERVASERRQERRAQSCPSDD